MTFASMRPFFIYLVALRALTGRFYFSMSERLSANIHHSDICRAVSLSLSLETLQMYFYVSFNIRQFFLPLFMNAKFSCETSVTFYTKIPTNTFKFELVASHSIRVRAFVTECVLCVALPK